MSHYANCIPNEYSPYLIRQDMIKSEFNEIPIEEDIEEVISEGKRFTANRIIDMIQNGKGVAEIREWCEYSQKCTIPITSVNTLSVNGLLSRFDYFNYELNRIIREEEIRVIIEERRKQGALFDATKVEKKLEAVGYGNLTDDFSRVDAIDVSEIVQIADEVEQRSQVAILDALLGNADEKVVVEEMLSNPEIVFSEEELLEQVHDVKRKHRFLLIAQELSHMGNTEMWDLVNNIESFKIYRTSQELTGRLPDSKFPDNQMTEMLKLYQYGTDSLHEGYMFQIARLSIPDLTQLVRLIQGLIYWRSTFHYVPRIVGPIDKTELSDLIVKGFSSEHGMDPSIFMMFLTGLQ